MRNDDATQRSVYNETCLNDATHRKSKEESEIPVSYWGKISASDFKLKNCVELNVICLTDCFAEDYVRRCCKLYMK